MGADNLYFLNGLDMYTTYGFAPARECSKDLLKPRKRKEVYSNNWAERNGKEYDLLGTPKYEDRQILLKGWLLVTDGANSETTFWTKYNALKAAFNVTGTVTLRCAELGTTNDIKVFYLDMPALGRQTRLKGASVIACEIEILLQEVQNG